MENDMKNIVKRIKEQRLKLGYSFQDLADKTGMSKSTLQRYETGAIKNVPLDKLEVLANALLISSSYLLGWDEKPRVDSSVYTLKEKDIIKKYRNSDVGVRSVIDTVLDMSEKISSLGNSTLKEDTTIYTVYKEIPCYPRLASAGNGQYVFDDVPFETIKVDAIKYRKADYAIQVNGDSMEPTFYDSDTLLVARHELPEKGEVGIFIVDGSGYVKRMGSKELLSDNPDYPSVKGTDGICMGKVLGKI